jgi:hypothetical protein
MRVRAATLAANIPFFVFVQSTDFGGNYPIIDREPSESEMRLNSWAPLAAGAKAINYFTYNFSDTHDSYFFDSNNNPTQFYHNVAAANGEIAHQGRALRFLTSTDVRFIPGGVSITPDDLTNWNTSAGPGTRILSIEVDGPPAQDKDGLIGFFEDDAGQDYFMLVNMYTSPTLDATQTSLGFTITFDNTVNSLWYVNRATGQVEQIDLVNHILNWTLPGGTGDLFKYSNGDFPGIPLAPVPGDFDSDGDVDGTDFVAWQTNFPKTSGATLAMGDADGDGDVDGADFVIWQTNFPTAAGIGVSSVPEPYSLSILFTAMLVGVAINHGSLKRSSPMNRFPEV